MAKENSKLIANNKKAFIDFLLKTHNEQGISLHGTEVKSLAHGKMQRERGIYPN